MLTDSDIKASKQIECLVRISGIEVTGKIENVNVATKKSISDLIFPETLLADNPILISAPTGKGKSTFITNTLAKYAAENGKTILFVSSRVAINTQQKKVLARSVGETALLEELTSKGWRAREKIGCVTVITYHRLFTLMKSPEEVKILRKFDFFIFDEVHALQNDALFTPCTGELCEKIPIVFYNAIRIYMSATPSAIIGTIAQKERPNTLTVYTWKSDFNWVKPYFFSDVAQLAECINTDGGDAKWLIFIESIEEGTRFSKLLKCSCSQVSSATREVNSAQWDSLLDDETFESKVLISTNVLDSGVNFKDPRLRKIVTFSHDAVEIIQQLGRIRRNKNEIIELYLFDIPLPELRQRKNSVRKALKALELIDHKAAFLESYIYGDALPPVRKFFSVSKEGEATLNLLAKKHLEANYELLSTLEKAAVKNKGYSFSGYICKVLGQKLPSAHNQWLDGRKNGTNEKTFANFIQKNLQRPIDENEQEAFSNNFRSLYVAAFGKAQKDRADRNWKSTAIRNRLESLNWAYTLEVSNGIWKIIRSQGGE